MAVLISDNFNRADSGNLGANWTNDYTGFQIVSNQASVSTSLAPSPQSYWSGTFNTASADYDVTVTLHTTDTNGALGFFGRRVANYSFYWVQMSVQDQTLKLFKRVVFSDTEIGNYDGTYSSGNTYTFRLNMVGSTIKVFEGVTERISVTDSDITGIGKPGIFAVIINAASDWDDFLVEGTFPTTTSTTTTRTTSTSTSSSTTRSSSTTQSTSTTTTSTSTTISTTTTRSTSTTTTSTSTTRSTSTTTTSTSTTKSSSTTQSTSTSTTKSSSTTQSTSTSTTKSTTTTVSTSTTSTSTTHSSSTTTTKSSSTTNSTSTTTSTSTTQSTTTTSTSTTVSSSTTTSTTTTLPTSFKPAVYVANDKKAIILEYK